MLAESGVPPLEHTDLVDRLVAELVARGRLHAAAARPPPLPLALMIVDELTRYPIDNGAAAWVPWNYCALLRLLPQDAPYRPALRSLLDAAGCA